MSEQTRELDRKDLKVMAYKERLGNALEEIADLRVDMTILSQQANDYARRVSELEQQLAEYQGAEEPPEDEKGEPDVEAEEV